MTAAGPRRETHRPCAIGVDIGTSGVRALCMDAGFGVVATAHVSFAQLNADRRDPAGWWLATRRVLRELLSTVPAPAVTALAIDGTSGTMIPVDRAGAPLASARLYNDRCEDGRILDDIGAHAPRGSAAHGATSGLAKLIQFSSTPGARFVLHEADWIASRLSGLVGVSDENNALKTGYDPVARAWPDWIAETSANTNLLPDVKAPGEPVGCVSREIAAEFGLAETTVVVAGSTDGCASFLATGADAVGDGVTALGTTLTIKMLSAAPIFAPEYGIYSHRLGDRWLAGGASNTGGNVLSHFFTSADIACLSEDIDPDEPTGLGYYPLLRPGERFPISDPDLPPRLTPRPESDAAYLQGLLEGIAEVEQLAYRRLAELGGPSLASVRSVGGGAGNPAWTRIRERLLGVPFLESASTEAAAGAARLALKGAATAGLAVA